MVSNLIFNQEYELSELVSFVGEKIEATQVTLYTYISTDNMLVDRGGVEPATKLPSASRFNHFKSSDTLFSNIRTYFRKVWLADFEGGASPDVLIFRSNDPKVLDPNYLYFLLSNEDFINYTVLTAKGAKMPRGDKTAIKQYRFFLPEIEKQKEIGFNLLNINKKIQLNRQTNQTLEHIAQAIFKSWFVDFEPVKAKIAAKQAGANAEQIERAAIITISGKTPAELEQLPPDTLQQLKNTAALFPDTLVGSELGEIPDGWEVKSLDEVAHYQNGLALQKFRPTGGEAYLPVLKISQLKKGFADAAEKAKASIKPECIVNSGDIVFSWSGSLIVDVWCGGKVALNQHLYKVTSKDYPKWFYYNWTKHHLKVFQQIAADKAVTMGHIKREHLSQAKCVVPSKGLNEISLINDLLVKEIEQRVEVFMLQELRDTLLPKLLSGELSVMK